MNFPTKALRLLAAGMLALLPGTVLAALITVNTTDDENNGDGDCSLREAVAAANTNGSVDGCGAGDSTGDTVFIAVSGTINVSSTIQITEDLVILGPGAEALTISGQDSTSLFIVNMPDATHDFELTLVTLADGRESVPGAAFWLQQGGTFRFDNVHFRNNEVTATNQSGGAIALQLPVGNANESRVELVRCRFVNNAAGSEGGALSISGNPTYGDLDSLIIEESEFIGNRAGNSGGAISAFDVTTMTVDRSRFHDNQTTGTGASMSPASGGAIDRGNYSSTTSELTRITNSTFTSNRSDDAGGAIRAISSTLLIENSTFFGNRANGGLGEAIHTRGDTTAAIFFSTFVENNVTGQSQSGAISASGTSQITLSHSVVWSEIGAEDPECRITSTSGASITSQGYNIDASGTCTGHPDDLPMTDPVLSAPGDFGDNTSWVVLETLLPLAGSPTLDGGAQNCTAGFGVTLATDQRGEPRPVNGDGVGDSRCDIGAVEYQNGSDPVTRTISVTLDGSSTGRVESSPAGINCPSQACTADFAGGTEVTLTALLGPEPGVAFAGWSGDCTGTGDCVLSLDGDKSVTATFKTVTDELFADRFEDSP